MKRLWVVLFVIACKGKGAAPAAGSASAAGSAAVAADAAVVVNAAAAPAVKGVLQLVDDEDATHAIAFDKKAPRLPAISADGKLVADYVISGYPGMIVFGEAVVIRPLADDGESETLTIVDDGEVEKLEEDFATTPPAPALGKKMKERGAAIVKRLDGFQSLVPIEVKSDGYGDPQFPVKVPGDLAFSAAFDDDSEALLLTLANASGRVTRRAQFERWLEGPDDGSCNYLPTFEHLFTDQGKQKLFTKVSFRYRDECTRHLEQFVAWDLAGEDPDPSAPLAKDAVQIDRSNVTPATTKADTGTQLVTTTSADGKSAWASLIAPDGARASYVLANTADGWRVIATTSTKPVANAAANKDAKAGKLKSPPAFTVEAGAAGLREAFAKLATAGMTAPRAKMIAFGSGPGERTTTGAGLAKGWNAGWKGKTTITSSVARLAPSGMTGWVAANVELAKAGYKIPFHIFAVFDKASSGEWTLVHLHFSV